jgi:hypothetical protein
MFGVRKYESRFFSMLGIPVQATVCLFTIKAHLQVLVELGHSSTELPLNVYLSLSTVIIQGITS